MKDNKPIEEQAESYVKSQLLKYEFSVVKPSFDKLGSDLIIVDSNDKQNVRIIKVQSKGRTINDKSTNVKIPITYVEYDFILFIYTVDIEKTESCFIFFPEDIQQWKLNDNNYTLSFNKNKVSTEYFQNRIFDKKSVIKIQAILKKTPIKKYTSIIIDGIFLEKAIIKTIQIYKKIWPDKEFIKPDLNSIIKNILNYFDRFKSEKKGINCYILLSDSFDLESIVNIDYSANIFKTDNENQVRTFINKINEIIAFEVIEQLERLTNNDNIILVADDVIYENELNKYKDSGIEMILVKLHENNESNMFVAYQWGDIMYPLGISIGLEKHEL
jgi:hypothetical protein